jgi:hypothetical protein
MVPWGFIHYVAVWLALLLLQILFLLEIMPHGFKLRDISSL